MTAQLSLDAIADAIDAAVDLMEREGRIKGAGYREGEGFCANGALDHVSGIPRHQVSGFCVWPPGREEIEATLAGPSLLQFNDSTVDDQVVFDRMRDVAKQLRIESES